MYSEINENFLLSTYETFNRESNKIMNEIKGGKDDATIKHLHKEINVLHLIEINILKLKTLKKTYDEKIKNL